MFLQRDGQQLGAGPAYTKSQACKSLELWPPYSRSASRHLRKVPRPRSTVRTEPDFCRHLTTTRSFTGEEADCVHCPLGEADENFIHTSHD
jgi:hypothetical protein